MVDGRSAKPIHPAGNATRRELEPRTGEREMLDWTDACAGAPAGRTGECGIVVPVYMMMALALAMSMSMSPRRRVDGDGEVAAMRCVRCRTRRRRTGSRAMGGVNVQCAMCNVRVQGACDSPDVVGRC